MASQKKIFTSGINSDTADEYLAAGMDRYRLNVRVLSSQSANEGAIETVNGNTLVTFTLPSGVNTVIGAREYQLKKKIYYFVHNDNRAHLILEYDQVTNTIEEVFRDTLNILRFDVNYLITGINIIKLDENNDLLYWTNFLNEPRKLNIQKAKLFMQGDYVNGYKFPFDPLILNRIKQPPLCPPTYTWLLNSESPLTGSRVIARVGTFYQPITSTASIIFFKDEVLDTSNEFNNSTYVYTAASTGVRTVSLTVAYLDLYVYTQASAPTGTGLLFILKNGVVVSSNSVTYGYTQTNDPILPNNRTWEMLNYATISLSIDIPMSTGDTLSFYASALASSGDAYQRIVSSGTSLTVVKPDSVDVRTNYLYKKLFRFKVQFGYDDYELSAWSPISKYVFPNTTTGGKEDIISQDNLIRIYVPTGNSIVTRIRVAAQEVSSEDFVLIADLDKEALNIPDNSTYVLDFYNQGNYAPLNAAESAKLFDYVPLKSKAQELLPNNRLADGNIFEGYDPVEIDVRLTINYEALENVYAGKQNKKFPVESYLKGGGIYTTGIVYYDEAGNRSGLANIRDYRFDSLENGYYGSVLYMPFMNSSDYTPPSTYKKIQWTTYPTLSIYHAPPEGFSHYQVVMSHNKGMGRYIQFPTDNIEYIDLATGGVVAPSAADGLRVYLTTLDNYNTSNLTSLVYGYQTGDRIRFIANATDDEYPYNEQDVLLYNSGSGYVDVRVGINTPLTLTTVSFVEIFNPSSNATDILYEIGECYKIKTDANGRRFHTGNIQDQSITVAQVSSTSGNAIAMLVSSISYSGQVGDFVYYTPDSGGQVRIKITGVSVSAPYTIVIGEYAVIESPADVSNNTQGLITSPAKVTIIGGDTFRTNDRYLLSPPATGGATYWIEKPNASNFFSSVAPDFGRPNRSEIIAGEYKGILRPTTVYYSEALIPETFINGLSSVYDTNYETYNQNYGSIQKLYADKQELYMFQELKIASVPVSRIIYDDLQGNITVGASENVLRPQAKYYDGEYGIGVYPESFAVYGNAKYGVDVRRGVIWRLSTDGLTPISKLYGQDTFISNQFKAFNSSATKVNLYGCYDVRFSEYILASPTFTLAFNEKHNFFSTFYSFTPEMMVGNMIDFISFKTGGLYTHNTNASQNEFYGSFTPSEVWTVLNDNPMNVKILQSIEVDSDDKWAVYEIISSNGQQSNLIEDDFTTIENVQYAPVRMDETTPNVNFPLINGDPMRDRTFLLKFRYNPQQYNKLFALNLRYIMSNYHNLDSR
jgi:hypothetical protein